MKGHCRIEKNSFPVTAVLLLDTLAGAQIKIRRIREVTQKFVFFISHLIYISAHSVNALVVWCYEIPIAFGDRSVVILYALVCVDISLFCCTCVSKFQIEIKPS